jgi:hypothetical protein
VYGMSTDFGGGHSTGFGLIYDKKEDVAKFEPRHRLLRIKQGAKKTRVSPQWGGRGGVGGGGRVGGAACIVPCRLAPVCSSQVLLALHARAQRHRATTAHDRHAQTTPASHAIMHTRLTRTPPPPPPPSPPRRLQTRKQWKDAKRKSKKTWGTGRRLAARMAKKAASG